MSLLVPTHGYLPESFMTNFTQLQACPVSRWLLGDIGVDQSPRSVFDQHEDIQHTKVHGYDGTKITGNNGVCVILRERSPRLVSSWSTVSGPLGMYFLIVRGDTEIPSFTSSPLAIRSSPR